MALSEALKAHLARIRELAEQERIHDRGQTGPINYLWTDYGQRRIRLVIEGTTARLRPEDWTAECVKLFDDVRCTSELGVSTLILEVSVRSLH